MKMSEAEQIIKGKPKGFRVHFEKVREGFLLSDFFPDRGEELIPSEDDAWNLARSFASKTRGSFVNIYVINEHFVPVQGYQNKGITNR